MNDENELFRKEAVDKITSPEDLNTYIKVLNPRVCEVLLLPVMLWLMTYALAIPYGPFRTPLFKFVMKNYLGLTLDEYEQYKQIFIKHYFTDQPCDHDLLDRYMCLFLVHICDIGLVPPFVVRSVRKHLRSFDWSV